MTEPTRHDPAIAKLLAKRRQELPDDEFISGHEGTNDDGHKIKTNVIRGDGGTKEEIEVNMTVMYRPAPSTTSDLEILRIEAKQAANGNPPENPHVPASESLLTEAKRVFKSEGLTPAWEVTA